MRIRDELEVSTIMKGLKQGMVHSFIQSSSSHCLSNNKTSYCKTLGHCLTFPLAHWLRSFQSETYYTVYSYSVRLRPIEFMAVWFTLFLHARIELALNPSYLEIVSDACESNGAVLKVISMKPWVNTNLSDVKIEQKVEWQRAGLTFFIVNSGVPWVCFLL